MHDTKLNSRQNEILDLLEKEGALSRAAIVQKLSVNSQVSRITIIRDLNMLESLRYIVISGKGRATTYKLREKNPILREVDINSYFNTNFNQRTIRKQFNNDIYSYLVDLFSQKERIVLDNAKSLYAENTGSLESAIYKRELERFIIEFSWKSSQIEGNTYELLETEVLIKQKIEARGRSKKEAIMILNHKDAFDSVLKNIQSFKRLTLSDVMQLHGIMIKDLDVPTGIRTQVVGITGTLYTPIANKHELEIQLRNIISLINKTTYPPAKALVASCMIAYLQPFADGNKRASRMISNALLLAYGYYPLSYRDVDVNEFIKAMVVFYEQNNLYHLKRIFLEQIQFSAENYFRTKK